ncbi:MAG TPA: penicillin-binding protein 2, partial [Burkholderiales bacterium]|nr:penicillin-binding protein 2 [Burkholderiales bacterium]
RVITDLFEPGSTLKPFTIALALETGKVTPATMVHTAPGRLTIANYTIHDVHPAAALSLSQVVQKSSNVGAARLALAMPSEAMWDMFQRVGFGAPPQLGFPGAAAGRLRPYKTWRPIEQATMAYGHGISVSLAQLARAYTVFARDGELVPLTLVKTNAEAVGEKVLSAASAKAVRAMLELAVQPGGTGPRARIMGWRVAGKTGTAHKQENGGYAVDKYLASFAGFAPVSAPRLVVAVMIDEPSAGQHYGGSVAAPVFAHVMQGALRLLGVPHDAPLEPLELPRAGDEAGEST